MYDSIASRWSWSCAYVGYVMCGQFVASLVVSYVDCHDLCCLLFLFLDGDWNGLIRILAGIEGDLPPQEFIRVRAGGDTPPMADASRTQHQVECSQANQTASVLLDASASRDFDIPAQPLTFTWRDNTGTTIAGPSSAFSAQVTLALRAHDITLIVADPYLSTSTTFTVTVTHDIAPTLKAPNDLTIATPTTSCQVPSSSQNDWAATAYAYDLCAAQVTITNDLATTTLDRGIHNITFTADDGTLTTTGLATITVVDQTAPNITHNAPDAQVQVQCDSQPFIDINGATATDNCDANLTVNTDISQVNTSVPGPYSIFYTATDSSANTAYASRLVSVLPYFASDALQFDSPL